LNKRTEFINISKIFGDGMVCVGECEVFSDEKYGLRMPWSTQSNRQEANVLVREGFQFSSERNRAVKPVVVMIAAPRW